MSAESPTGSRWAASVFAMAFLLGIVYVVWLAFLAPDGGLESTRAVPELATETPTGAPISSETVQPGPIIEVSPAPSQQPWGLKVGIVAGHWRSDSGAVCDDGLQEVTINLDVASRVVAILQYEGYDAELLPEYSEKLVGYEADAFVSIHADACNVPEASGFKVARVAASAIPEEEDRLVECLVREYGEMTGLSFHRNSITYDMQDYHAFNEIHPLTPGAIIELGFMGADRELLTEDAYHVAQGVARGIACFLEGE
ncbi:MAG: N-acetylmuramoyl-L-alanine amidase [Anaerolineae bacterium]